MSQKNHQKKPQNSHRKVILKTFSASTNTSQMKNSIRNFKDAHTHNFPFQNISNTLAQPVKLIQETPLGHEPQVLALTDSMKEIKEPLMKMVDQNELIARKLGKISAQIANIHKPQNQYVSVDFNQYPSWKVWMGKVFAEIFQRSFHLYSTQKLLYDEMRAFCCEKILQNLLSIDMLNLDVLKATPWIEWENQVKKILQHECFKYPQTSQIVINKKLQQKVDMNQINNFESDDYDLLDKINVQFKYKQSGDYTQEIMTFLNKVITLPENIVNKNQGQNLFNSFHTFFSNVFGLVNHRNRNKDTEILLEQILKDDEYCHYKFMEEDQIEYKEKVKTYTKVEIGSKIPLNAPLYTYDEIVSGKIQIKNKPVGRVIDKWIDELRQKILNPQKFINQIIHRFKGQQPGERTKLTKNQKQILVSKLKNQKTNYSQFHDKLKENVEYISQKLMGNLGNFTEMTFMDESQRAVGEFACKMEQASIEYSIQKLNFLIGALLKSVERLKDDINKTKPYSFIGEDIKLNLVTFKIGDLLRCKFTSKQDEVIRIFDFLITMSEMNYLNLFKIIRIKNRLHQSTRDILINALFKNQVVCEIQLAVHETTNQKQKFMDKFNHFLYEIKRAQVGIMLEICNIWVNNSPKAESFRKQLAKERQRKLKNLQTICPNAIFQLIQNKHKIQKLPFICKLCKIFQPRQRTIFASVIFEQYPDPICGQCLSTRIQKTERVKYIFGTDEKPAHIANYLSKFRLYEALKEVFDIEEAKKHKYLILIPVQSKKINKFTVIIVQTNNMLFFVHNYLTDDGKLEVSVKYQFTDSMSIKEQQKKFFQKYCIFAICLAVEMKPATLSKQNFNGLLQKDFKKIQTFQSKNNNRLNCLYTLVEQESILFPHYQDPTVDITQKLKKDTNIMKIIKNMKNSKQVLELSGIQLADEMRYVPSGVKIKMNTIVKELYLNENALENMDFVTEIHGLAILTAKKNKISRIPEMPENIEIIDLAANQITKIEGFSNKTYQKLRIINLCLNKITKIENLENAPNLKELSLLKNQVTQIEGLEKLQKLTRLNLSFNPIQKVQNLSGCTSIEFLSLGNTQINQLNGMESLDSLMTLILDVSKVSMSDTLQLPKKIKNLNLSNNNITSLTPLKKLDQIQQLILNDNIIHTFEPSYWLQNIKLLNLSRNKIEDIPEMKSLTDLKELYLAHNSITQVKGLEENMFLSVLDVSHNKIKHLKNIKYLVNLTKLSAKNNQIQHMEEFDNLRSLNEIHLANNLIEKIIALPHSVKKIDLQNNRIKAIDWVSVLVKKKSDEDKVEEINLSSNFFVYDRKQLNSQSHADACKNCPWYWLCQYCGVKNRVRREIDFKIQILLAQLCLMKNDVNKSQFFDQNLCQTY